MPADGRFGRPGVPSRVEPRANNPSLCLGHGGVFVFPRPLSAEPGTEMDRNFSENGRAIGGRDSMNFQQIILTLQDFWAGQNCLIVQPYDVETGAGTMNPMTFL